MWGNGRHLCTGQKCSNILCDLLKLEVYNLSPGMDKSARELAGDTEKGNPFSYRVKRHIVVTVSPVVSGLTSCIYNMQLLSSRHGM